MASSKWTDRRITLKTYLSALQHKKDYHITNLDTALTALSKIGVLYKKLAHDNKKALLRLLVEKIIVDSAGMICHVELLAPFAYLNRVAKSENAKREDQCVMEKTKTHLSVGQCSECISSGVPGGIRTPGLLFRRQPL